MKFWQHCPEVFACLTRYFIKFFVLSRSRILLSMFICRLYGFPVASFISNATLAYASTSKKTVTPIVFIIVMLKWIIILKTLIVQKAVKKKIILLVVQTFTTKDHLGVKLFVVLASVLNLLFFQPLKRK